VRPVLRPRWIVAITVSAATAAVVGCGGGGSQSVSAAELVQKADAICGTERTSYDRVQAHPPPNAKIAAAETDELIRATDDANSKLRDLKPPQELEAAYDRYLEARNRVVGQMKRGKDAAESQDSAAYGAAQAAVAREAPQRRKLAVAVGLKVCSSSSGSA
jgi:hypothetical protein